MFPTMENSVIAVVVYQAFKNKLLLSLLKNLIDTWKGGDHLNLI